VRQRFFWICQLIPFLIGIDEVTALVKRSGTDYWQVVGDAKVHILKGLPEQQLTAGESISF
jgi:hypothetical protein